MISRYLYNKPTCQISCEVPFKLSSGQAHPFGKHVFGYVTSLIYQSVMTSYSALPREFLTKVPSEMLNNFKKFLKSLIIFYPILLIGIK